MSDIAASAFVRQELVPQRAAPIKTTGFVGFLRTRLFNSPTNILITIVSLLLLWFVVVPAIRFLLVDAVWSGSDRNACLAENAGRPVGACWPFIQAKLSQFIYGFYPEPERWRVNLTFLLAAVLLLPLLIPRLPAKGINSVLFFLAFPVVAFFLLYGGGLNGFGVSWTAGLLSGFNDSIGDGGRKLVAAGETTAVIGPLLWLLGKLIVLISIGDLLAALAVDLVARADPDGCPPGVDRLGADGRDRLARAVLPGRRIPHRLARADREPLGLCRHRHRDRGDEARPGWIACGRHAVCGAASW